MVPNEAACLNRDGGFRAEDSLEDGVHGAQLAMQVEGVRERLLVEEFADVGVGSDAVLETGFGFPGGHGVSLDPFVRIFARGAAFDQILQKLPRKNQALRGVDVPQHALGKYLHVGDNFCRAVEHVIHQNRRVGEYHALDGTVRDIALVPERDILQGREGIHAHHARQPADLFARYGIAFMRHRRAAALLAAKRFFHFAHFCALQVADFLRDALQRRGDDRECREILSVAVAFNYLGSDRCSREAQALADLLFDFRTQMRAGTNGAGNFADGDLLRGDLKAREIAAIFRVPIGDLQPESNRLGVNTVGASNFWRVLKFPGAAVQNFAQRFDFFLDQLRRFADEQRLRGVHHVVGSEPIMQPARGLGIGDRFLHGDGEGDYVVANFGFNFVDARHVDAGALAQYRSGFARHHAGFGESFAGSQLDFQPLLKAIFFAPDAAHFRAGVTCYQN